MNVIFTCGGTGGHINPAIAIADLLKQRHPDCNILFIGATGKMEETLVPKAGYDLKCLPASGLSRKLSFKGLKQNLHAASCVLGAVKACKRIFREFQPDAVVGTGGYASFPALYAAQQMGIPTCVHESNAVPGVTTKMVANKADHVLVAFKESAAFYKHPERVQVVGMPVRQDFWEMRRTQARKELGLGEEKLVVSTFGSQGARVMNEMTAQLFALEQKNGFPFHHIHATGSFGAKWMPEQVAQQGVELASCPTIDMREYIYNMPTVLAAADVVLGRSGSGTCNEIAATGTPCILVPSPNVTNDHQTKNAKILEDCGAAILIPESQCSAQKIYDTVTELLDDPARCARMSAALRGMAVIDSAEKICHIVENMCKR